MSTPPGSSPLQGIGAGNLLNIGTALQNIAQNGVQIVQALGRLTPESTSGLLLADTLVQVGFVRLLGVSVVAVGSPVGGLFDAPSLAAASSTTNQVYTIPGQVGYYPVNMVFVNGLVYQVGTSEKVSLYFGRI